MKEYKTKIQIETGGVLGVRIQIAYNRELTEDERESASSFIHSFVNRMHRNSRLLDPKEIQKVKDERDSILALFSAPIYVKEIPNEYWPDNIYPWYLITTHKGVIKIGWRKRVININWEASDISMRPEDVTPDDVTKGAYGDKYIHAWGYEKAKEYLDTLLK